MHEYIYYIHILPPPLRGPSRDRWFDIQISAYQVIFTCSLNHSMDDRGTIDQAICVTDNSTTVQYFPRVVIGAYDVTVKYEHVIMWKNASLPFCHVHGHKHATCGTMYPNKMIIHQGNTAIVIPY